MIGKKFKMLEVLDRMPNSFLRCKCDCGNERVIRVGHFNAGYFGCCGCTTKHGHAGGSGSKKSREYVCYYNMMARCHKKQNKRFKDYGAKGIVVCERWKNSFINFLSDMGKCPPGFTIDRICNEGSYSSENCRWVSRKENQSNRGVSMIWTVYGVEFQSSIDAAKFHDVSPSTINAWCKGRKAFGRFYPKKDGCSVSKKF